jgi:glucose/arabinose dehydrogenase
MLVCTTASAQTFSDPGFTAETVLTLPAFRPVGLTFAADGRMFVWQENGIVRVVKNGALLPTPFIDISARVNAVNDRGLLGLALDPAFATNGHVYLLYTYEDAGNPNDPSPKTARLTRVTADPANPDVALANSEVVLLGSVGTPPCSNYPATADCIGADADSHTIGTVRFAPDGKLLVGSGDGAAYAFVDPLALRSQDLDSLNGKILRLNPDGTAPSDNPFHDGNPNSNRSKVYSYGLRNPYRFAVHPTTGEAYIGEVGWNSLEEQNRGRGANFGWPCFEGNSPQADYQGAFSQCQGLPWSATRAPIYVYGRGEGNSAIGGTFYTGMQFPPEYRGAYFFADYGGRWIRRATLNASGDFASVVPFASLPDGIVSLEQGPDGSLYFIELATGRVRRVRYADTPTAVASGTPTSGYSPLTVAFSSAGSSNPAGGTLTYSWDFGDGTTSSEANPSKTYTSATVRTFTATLTVTNSRGASSSATVSVTVGSRPPVPTITTPATGIVVPPGTTVVFAGEATDPDEALEASALAWQILLHHNDHVHPLTTTNGATGSFVTEAHGEGTFYYEIILTATDSSGLTGTDRVFVYPSDNPGPGSSTYLSDLPWASATNGWGPVERDRSNAEASAGDGATLTLNGVTYAKGLGVHAASEVRYVLGGSYTRFRADVGVDDEVGTNGSVVFEVWVDGVKAHDSGVMTGGSATQSVDVDVTGAQQLRLVVTDAGDNMNYDHADWANARLEGQVQVSHVYVSDLPWASVTNGWGPVERDRSNAEAMAGDGATLTLNGVTYAKGLGVHASSDLVVNLDGTFTSFRADVGVDDEVGTNGSVVFEVWVDGVKAHDSGVMTGDSATQPVDVDITGAQQLRLVVTDAGDNINFDHADWAGARLVP